MAATATTTFPDTPLLDAVTVILVPDAAVPATRVAVARPFASVVACVTASPPAVDEKVTVAPITKLLLASVAVALMVALLLPSAAICASADPTVVLARGSVVVVVVVVVVVPLSVCEPPPQPAKSAVATVIHA